MASRAPAIPEPKRRPESKKQEAPNASADVEGRIRERAYELYMERGGLEGSELDDWLQAEREITD